MEKGEEVIRVRIPEEKEILGTIVARIGATRFIVACADGRERMCRVPGRLKRDVWVKEGDVVLVVPWPVEGEKKGDIVWRYKPIEADWLRQRGYLKELE